MAFKRTLIASAIAAASYSAAAANEFVVDDIKVEGLQRVGLGAALTYIPVQVGDQATKFRVAQSIKSLYSSGHFDSIKVNRDGDTLVFVVKERPTISDVNFEGNDDIKDEQLQDSLNSSGIKVGEPLDKTVLSLIENSLEEFYHGVGKYGANVEAQITYLPRNRVSLTLNFTEGDSASIKQFNIVGNKLFADEKLLDQVELKFDLPWWDFMSQDRYQKETLKGDLETISSYYLDRGYIRFNIDSTQVSLTPEKEAVYITLNVTEGEKYKLNKVELTGDLLGFEDFISNIMPLKSGNVYSGAEVTYTEEMISKYLGRFGYAYPQVRAVPTINDEDKTVDLNIVVDPGKRIYVRRINFEGNDVTSDEVLRRKMRQLEGAWLSNSLVELSKSHLQRLPYLETVEFDTQRLSEEEDQVDVTYKVKEQASGSFNAGVGYGSNTGLSLQAGVQQSNFLGTGSSLGFSVSTVRYQKRLAINYTEPYFTIDGVSLGGSISYTEFDAGSANLEEYKSKTFAVGATLGIPLDEYSRLSAGLTYKHNMLSQLGAYEQVRDFYDTYADPNDPDGALKFDDFEIGLGWSRSTLNRGTFPTAGSSQSVSLKVTTPNSDSQYFKLYSDSKFYFPLSRNQKWSFLTRFRLGYGNGYGEKNGNDQILPFRENFRAGGASTLRGFENNTVGPKAIYRNPTTVNIDGTLVAADPSFDTITMNTRSIGGNAMALAGLELIVPTPFVGESIENSLRTSLFVDAGNVWDTEFDLDDFANISDKEQTEDIPDFADPGRFRASAGLSVQWLSPMGPMIFSFAKALKEEDGDDVNFFSFNIGSTF